MQLRQSQRFRRRLLPFVLAACVLAFACFTASASAYTTLAPGEVTTISQTLKVNLVFVGFAQGSGMQQVDQARLLANLPSDLQQTDRSLRFAIRYNPVWAGQDFTNRFFSYLSRIAVDRPLTAFQQAYNDQLHSSIDVTNNCWINGPSVERWLASNAASLRIDSTRYTVFLVNWYGRPDFRFHVYAKTNEPDPDTGFNMGADSDYTKTIAWGGTAADDPQDGQEWLRRLWFCDLSAGPDSYSGSWNVDDDIVAPGTTLQLGSGGAPCYRIPPIWEYGNTSGYRPFDDLTGDLTKLVGNVAVRSLFTMDVPGGGGASSRLVPAGQTIPRNLQVAISMFDLVPGLDGSQFLQPDYVTQRLQRLQPWRRFTSTSQRIQGLPLSEAQAAYEAWLAWWFSGFTDNSQSIYPNDPDNSTFAGDLLVYTRKYRDQLFTTGSDPFQLPVLAFSLPDPDAAWLYGFTYPDEKLDRAVTCSLTTPIERLYVGYGLTTTTVHEVGHQLGLRHPHDPPGVGGVPSGADYYMWTGSESNTMMSYIDTNWDFGQFDEDVMARNMTAAYINDANLRLGGLVGVRLPPAATSKLAAADGLATAALANYRAMKYQSAATKAAAADRLVLEAARLAGVASMSNGSTASALRSGSRWAAPSPAHLGASGAEALVH